MKKRVRIASAIVLSVLILAGAIFGICYQKGMISSLSEQGWHTDEQGITRYFDYWGDYYTSWWNIDGNTYYFDDQGVARTGWVEYDGKNYYFDETGILQTGWLELDDERFYLEESGSRYSGWLVLEDKKYYFNECGVMHTGWLSIDECEYYFAEDGAMCTGWQNLDEGRYLFSSDGAKRTGWISWYGDRFYLDDSMVTGWAEIDGNRYYFDDDGIMHVGWLELENKRYYLKASGVMATGWLERKGEKRFFDENGVMCTGWHKFDSDYYYFNQDGVAFDDEALIDAADEFIFDDQCTLILNRENPLPDDWEAYPIEVEDGWFVDGRCYGQFMQMLSDCRAAGNVTGINSAYRSPEDQQEIWDNRVALYMAEGASEDVAIARVKKEVAKPGYSEHQLGLAVDIDGFAAHSWMAKNSWRYGFVIRYPADKQHITNTVYEPWHVRYVGYDLAKLMYEENLCLEEYYEIYQ